ncbi:MAG: hypothetical protein JWO67_3250 [Streptosporangiaceae bacterium]|nr:hypothetical protein [Streptosporangiaceae bacterium]
MRKVQIGAIAAPGILVAAALVPLVATTPQINAVPVAAVDVSHPGETETISAAFKLKWQPTAPQALQEIDGLVADGTHGIKTTSMATVAADGEHTLAWKTGCSTDAAAVNGLDGKVTMGAWCFPSDTANTWFPQGVAISRTSTLDGVVLSWDDESTRRTRITVGPRPAVETSGKYRVAMLAVPSLSAAGRLMVSDVRPKPVSTQGVDDLGLHAGGIAVDGDRLYVADTAGGFRVFNLKKPYEVPTGKDTLGLDPGDGQFYAHQAKYALFEEGRYVYDSSAGTCKSDTLAPDSPSRNLCFSTVSVDRSYPTPGLVTTEYRRTSGVVAGKPVRVVRWPLNADGTLKTDAGGVVTSTTVYGTYTPRIQGVVAHYTTGQKTSVYYDTSLSASSGEVLAGTIYSDRGGRDTWSISGPKGGESFAFDPYAGGDRIWSVTEAQHMRMLFWVYRDELQPASDE